MKQKKVNPKEPIRIGYHINSPEVHFFVRDQHIKYIHQYKNGDIHILLHNGERLVISKQIEANIKTNTVDVNFSNYCTMIRGKRSK